MPWPKGKPCSEETKRKLSEAHKGQIPWNTGKTWQRDRYQDQVLGESGWTVLRFWGHEIRENIIACVDKIEGAINNNEHRG